MSKGLISRLKLTKVEMTTEKVEEEIGNSTYHKFHTQNKNVSTKSLILEHNKTQAILDLPKPMVKRRIDVVLE